MNLKNIIMKRFFYLSVMILSLFCVSCGMPAGHDNSMVRYASVSVKTNSQKQVKNGSYSAVITHEFSAAYGRRTAIFIKIFRLENGHIIKIEGSDNKISDKILLAGEDDTLEYKIIDGDVILENVKFKNIIKIN